jgi:hypothetical protein
MEVHMVRLARPAPWVFSVLFAALLGAAATAGADVTRRSARRCVRYSQKLDRGRTGVMMKLANRCRFPVTCSVEWKLVCAGGSGAVESAALELARGQADSVHASASGCGDGDWEIADVRWTCDPVKDAAP